MAAGQSLKLLPVAVSISGRSTDCDAAPQTLVQLEYVFEILNGLFGEGLFAAGQVDPATQRVSPASKSVIV